MKFYITGARRGLGEALAAKYGNCNSLEECDVFINCKHEDFKQVDLLYKAARLNKRIINISSNSGDNNKSWPHIYAVQKAALDKANEQLYYQGINTTSVRFGLFDTPRSQMFKDEKMSVEYCVDVIDWILCQPHKVKEVTITP